MATLACLLKTREDRFQLGGVPLIRRQLIVLSGAGVDEGVVVLGHHDDAIESAVRDFPITVVCNPLPDDGQASSVRVGLQALACKLDALVGALADQPMLNAQDITSLIAAFKQRGEVAMVVPRVAGNPVMFDAALCRADLPHAALTGRAGDGLSQPGRLTPSTGAPRAFQGQPAGHGRGTSACRTRPQPDARIARWPSNSRSRAPTTGTCTCATAPRCRRWCRTLRVSSAARSSCPI